MTEFTSEDNHAYRVEALTREPKEELVLPDVDTSEARFLTHTYVRNGDVNSLVSTMVIPTEGGELFYIDLNNDEDLTNDGEPRLFAADENEMVFFVHSESDPNLLVGRAAQRIPPFVLEDPEREARFYGWYIDEERNLLPSSLDTWRGIHPELEGEAGTYYFSERISVRRGKVSLGGTEYAIGLKDHNSNGRFDDKEDLLLVDLNRNGRLHVIKNAAEVFKPHDVFEVEGRRYRVSYIDPYGRSLRLTETDRESTAYFLKEWEAQRQEMLASAGKQGSLDPSFWSLTLKTTSGQTISLEERKGQYILLNFWGEWCAPCLEEIPALVAAHEGLPEEQLQIIGMLLSYDREAAEEIMREQGIGWPQVIVTEELQERFKVRAFPTNLLILPDGETYLQAGQVNEAFFERNVK